MTASEGGPPWGMRGQGWPEGAQQGPIFISSLTSSVGRMEGSLPHSLHRKTLGLAGLSFRKRAGALGPARIPFLRASSFCLRADEVGLIMTNLEKANQVRRRLLGLTGPGWGSPGLGVEEGVEFRSGFIELHPVLSTGARHSQKDPAPALATHRQNAQKWGDAGSRVEKGHLTETQDREDIPEKGR